MPHLTLYAPHTSELEKKIYFTSRGEMFLIVLMNNTLFHRCYFQSTLVLICLYSEFDSLQFLTWRGLNLYDFKI